MCIIVSTAPAHSVQDLLLKLIHLGLEPKIIFMILSKWKSFEIPITQCVAFRLFIQHDQQSKKR